MLFVMNWRRAFGAVAGWWLGGAVCHGARESPPWCWGARGCKPWLASVSPGSALPRVVRGLPQGGDGAQDEHASYRGLAMEFEGGHEIVCHSAREYVRGDVSTNSIESFFAILKRGIMGVYHNVSRKHLQRYLDEFEFRYNTRDVEDGERTRRAIQGAIGKRLLYRQPVG